VYAVRLFVRDKYYNGIVNIGMRPTFDAKSMAIEVHIFDFNEDIYGEELTVYFAGKIRDERKFGSAVALINQINADINSAKALLSKHA